MVAQCNICGAVLGAGNQGHKEVNGDTSIIRCDDCQASFVKFQRKKKIKVNPLTAMAACLEAYTCRSHPPQAHVLPRLRPGTCPRR